MKTVRLAGKRIGPKCELHICLQILSEPGVKFTNIKQTNEIILPAYGKENNKCF